MDAVEEKPSISLLLNVTTNGIVSAGHVGYGAECAICRWIK